MHPTETGGHTALLPGEASGMRQAAYVVDNLIGHLAEATGAAIVVAETFILFAGVVSRYVFNSPIIWTDELANFLFLWLSMIGTVVALRGNGHMRLTTLVIWVRPGLGKWFNSVAALVVIAFVVEILLPAYEYTRDQQFTELRTLGISEGWRAVSILIGMSLAAVIAVLRLVETTTLRNFLLAVLVVGGTSPLLRYFTPQVTTMKFGSLFVFFILIVGSCVAIGVPIAFAFGIATMSYLALTSETPISVVDNRMDDGTSNLLLLSVPMFVFLGLLMESTGIARAMVNFLVALVGHVRGGLSHVLLGAMYLVSGISGSKAAHGGGGSGAVSGMQRRGQHPGKLASLLATSSAMSETIPPSLVLITIGSVANVSISALSTGGLMPALVAAFALVVVVCWRARWDDVSDLKRAPAKEIVRTLLIAAPGLTLPFVIRGVVMGGIATATEVSTVGVVYTARCDYCLGTGRRKLRSLPRHRNR
jgi:TRAP-type C4-dicarboxylate transport system permease small subunit